MAHMLFQVYCASKRCERYKLTIFAGFVPPPIGRRLNETLWPDSITPIDGNLSIKYVLA